MNCRGMPELRQRLGSEYALGTLRGGARERLKRWLRDDPELAREVAQWEARLTPMASAVAPATPPQRVWQEIERRLAPKAARTSSVWRALGLVASAAAAALLVVAVLFRPPASMPASYIAVLSDPKTNQPVLA